MSSDVRELQDLLEHCTKLAEQYRSQVARRQMTLNSNGTGGAYDKFLARKQSLEKKWRARASIIQKVLADKSTPAEIMERAVFPNEVTYQ